MLAFIIIRILSAIPVVAILSVITFLIIQAPPGDYADIIMQQAIGRAGASFEEAKAQADAFRAANGLNDPAIVQYFNWIKGILLEGDFGQSYFHNKPVADIVAERLPATLALALTCHLLATLIGVGMGIVAAAYHNRWPDTVLSIIAFFGMTVPRFLMAIILLYILVFKMNATEIGSFFSVQYSAAPWSLDKFINLVQHIWPVVAIATFGGLAYNMRVMRSNLLDVMRGQYIEAARAKGLSGSQVLMRHAVPNALHPIIMFQGIALPYMLAGEIETAIVFSLATVGPSMVSSMAVGDVYVTSTFLFLLACTLIIGNIIADVLLMLVDPRIRRGGH